jgi:hypothetical protein
MAEPITVKDIIARYKAAGSPENLAAFMKQLSKDTEPLHLVAPLLVKLGLISTEEADAITPRIGPNTRPPMTAAEEKKEAGATAKAKAEYWPANIPKGGALGEGSTFQKLMTAMNQPLPGTQKAKLPFLGHVLTPANMLMAATLPWTGAAGLTKAGLATKTAVKTAPVTIAKGMMGEAVGTAAVKETMPTTLIKILEKAQGSKMYKGLAGVTAATTTLPAVAGSGIMPEGGGGVQPQVAAEAPPVEEELTSAELDLIKSMTPAQQTALAGKTVPEQKQILAQPKEQWDASLGVAATTPADIPKTPRIIEVTDAKGKTYQVWDFSIYDELGVVTPDFRPISETDASDKNFQMLIQGMDNAAALTRTQAEQTAATGREKLSNAAAYGLRQLDLADNDKDRAERWKELQATIAADKESATALAESQRKRDIMPVLQQLFGIMSSPMQKLRFLGERAGGQGQLMFENQPEIQQALTNMGGLGQYNVSDQFAQMFGLGGNVGGQPLAKNMLAPAPQYSGQQQLGPLGVKYIPNVNVLSRMTPQQLEEAGLLASITGLTGSEDDFLEEQMKAQRLAPKTNLLTAALSR